MELNNSTKKITMNLNATEFADFEVLAQTTGTAFKVGVSVNGASIGTANVDPSGLGSDYPSLNIESIVSNRFPIFTLKGTSGNVDNRNVGQITFYDDAAFGGFGGDIGFRTDGVTSGDRGSKFYFRTKLDGGSSSTHQEINNAGKITLNFSALSGGDLEVLAQTTGTAFKVEVSKNGASIGTANVDVSGLGSGYPSLNIESIVSNRFPILTMKGSSGNVDNRYMSQIAFYDDAAFGGFGGDITAKTDGVTSGDRGSKFHFRTKLDGGSSSIHQEINNAGKITLNFSALSTGDFEVKAETTGVLIYGDVSNKTFGINKIPGSSVTFDLTGTGSSRMERTTSQTNVFNSIFGLKHKTSANMVDGFGSALRFLIEDVSGVDEQIGQIGFVRDTADNKGKFVVNVGLDGFEEALTIDSNKHATFSGTIDTISVTGTGSGQVERTTSQTNVFNSVFAMKHKTSATMVDGFGPGLRFLVEDDSAVSEQIGIMGFVRDGADNFGAFKVTGGTDGFDELMEIKRVGGTNELSFNPPSSAGTAGSVYVDGSGFLKLA
jgi:hypothetical protein